MWNLKKASINHLIHKAEIETQMQRTDEWIPGGDRGGRNRETDFDTYTLFVRCLKY